MYGGDMTLWRKFANSLRLRLAMHRTNVAPATAQSEALAAVTAGVFASNDDNAQLMFFFNDTATTEIYTNVHVDKRDDYGMSKTFVDSLLSWNDPRLPVFA